MFFRYAAGPGQRQPLKVVVLIITILFLLWRIEHSSTIFANVELQSQEAYNHLQRFRRTTNIVDDIYNSTLGFQKVFGINLRERTDKRDISALAASYAGFNIEWLEGVRSEEVSDKAAPPNWDSLANAPGSLGSWRAHMNVLEHIVSNNIQTAFIVEDDADWSPFFKNQLFEYATGIRALTYSAEQSFSPYGDNWDFLWPGHCRAGPFNADQDIWVVENDMSTPVLPRRHARWLNEHEPAEVFQNDTRLVYKARAGVCIFAYGVTYASARKLLYTLATQPYPADITIDKMCHGHYVGRFDCYAVSPPLISTHRPEGDKSRDSDLRENEKDSGWHKEYTWDMVYSTMMNIPRVIRGHTITAQYPEDADYPEIEYNPNLKTPPVGYLKHFDFSDGMDDENSAKR